LDKSEEGTNGCQPGISRADTVGPLPFDVVEERKNDRCIEIVYGEDSRFDALGVTNKS
jgi:hypothetical protein